MTTTATFDNPPLWLSIETKIAGLDPGDLDAGSKEKTIQRIATELDAAGFNVTRHAANMLKARQAIDARIEVGRPMLTDLQAATEALTLEDVANPLHATIALIENVGEAWPAFQHLDRREDIEAMVAQIRLDLLVAKAKEIGGDAGIRYLITNRVAEATIIATLAITDAKLAEVNAAIAAELAEVARVKGLLKAVDDQSEEAKVKHLINNDVSDDSIVELAGIDREVIEAARLAMAEEMREKARLEAEAAAAKKAAAEGPALGDIPADQMLTYIESIREIMEFSDQENEIRAMCEQSSIPKSLVDAVVNDPAKLDELEAAAGG
jgi:hypothetical protein